ncbi:hypothetical protein BU15DRAFT_45727, partial [Melanogaster broomeanus]
ILGSCTSYTRFRQLLLIANEVVVGILLIMRTSALYGRDKCLTTSVVSIALGLSGVSIWSLIGQDVYSPIGVPGCILGYDNTGFLAHRLAPPGLAVPWEGLLIFDSMVFLLTLRKTYKTGLRSGLFSLDRKLNIMALICRDGSFESLTLPNIISFYVSRWSRQLEALLVVLHVPRRHFLIRMVRESISVTLMSRLMLNLHQNADQGISSSLGPRRDDLDDVAFTTELDVYFPSLPG